MFKFVFFAWKGYRVVKETCPPDPLTAAALSAKPEGDMRSGINLYLYNTLISSTSKISAEYGGMLAPAPCSPYARL